MTISSTRHRKNPKVSVYLRRKAYLLEIVSSWQPEDGSTTEEHTQLTIPTTSTFSANGVLIPMMIAFALRISWDHWIVKKKKLNRILLLWVTPLWIPFSIFSWSENLCLPPRARICVGGRKNNVVWNFDRISTNTASNSSFSKQILSILWNCLRPVVKYIWKGFLSKVLFKPANQYFPDDTLIYSSLLNNIIKGMDLWNWKRCSTNSTGIKWSVFL